MPTPTPMADRPDADPAGPIDPGDPIPPAAATPLPSPVPTSDGAPTAAVREVLEARQWARPLDMWTRVERDRALARLTHLEVLVTDHGCVVVRRAAPSAGPSPTAAPADAGRERWPPRPAAA